MHSQGLFKRLTLLSCCAFLSVSPIEVVLSFISIHNIKKMNHSPTKPHQLNLSPTKKKYNQQLGEFESLNISSSISKESSNAKRIVKSYDFSSFEPINYQLMWDIQKDILHSHLQRLENDNGNKNHQFWSVEDDQNQTFIHSVSKKLQKINKDDNNDGEKERLINSFDRYKGCDSIICLQHQPVYTLGTASESNFIKHVKENIDVVRIERGGEVTYHGPGQLTVYPIIDLRGYKQDIHWYMRALEEVIMLALKRVGVEGVSCLFVVVNGY